MTRMQTRPGRRRTLAVVAAFVVAPIGVGMWVAPGVVEAIGPQTYTVTTITDEIVVPGTGLSVREAMRLANDDEVDSIIELAAGATYTLACTPVGDDLPPADNSVGDLNHDPEFDEALTIEGNGSTIEQTCPGSRVLRDRSTAHLTLDDVTITGGTENGSGGGVKTDGAATLQNGTHIDGNSAEGDGGGIDMRNSNSLTITGGSSVSGNRAGSDGGGVFIVPNFDGPNGQLMVTGSSIDGNCAGADFGDGGEFVSCTGNEANGGGVFTAGTVMVTDSAITNNAAVADGGGIYHLDGPQVESLLTPQGFRAAPRGARIEADVVITNSTVSGNTAGTPEERPGQGGGIATSGMILLTNATIADNSASLYGSNLSAFDLDSYASVIALARSGDNCSLDSTTDQGYNYSDDDTCDFSDSSSTDDGGDPMLGPLAANGGPTENHLPERLTSPLVDQIPIPACSVGPDADQRGVARPQGNGCDIGAVEVVSQVVTADIVVVNNDGGGTATGADFLIEVYDGDGILVASGFDPEPGTGNASAQFLLAAGAYTFGVSGPAGYITSVVVTIVPVEAEMLGGLSAQFTLVPGEGASAVLTADDITTTTLVTTTSGTGILPPTGIGQSWALTLVAMMLLTLGGGALLATRRR